VPTPARLVRRVSLKAVQQHVWPGSQPPISHSSCHAICLPQAKEAEAKRLAGELRVARERESRLQSDLETAKQSYVTVQVGRRGAAGSASSVCLRLEGI
jgi:hypothetical protein